MNKSYLCQLSDPDTFKHCTVLPHSSLTVSWKVHCVAAHLVQFLDEFQVGLARFAEQTSEAAHAAIKPTEQRFLVSEQNANHGDQLKTVASVFSGTRVN